MHWQRYHRCKNQIVQPIVVQKMTLYHNYFLYRKGSESNRSGPKPADRKTFQGHPSSKSSVPDKQKHGHWRETRVGTISLFSEGSTRMEINIFLQLAGFKTTGTTAPRFCCSVFFKVTTAMPKGKQTALCMTAHRQTSGVSNEPWRLWVLFFLFPLLGGSRD